MAKIGLNDSDIQQFLIYFLNFILLIAWVSIGSYVGWKNSWDQMNLMVMLVGSTNTLPYLVTIIDNFD